MSKIAPHDRHRRGVGKEREHHPRRRDPVAPQDHSPVVDWRGSSQKRREQLVREQRIDPAAVPDVLLQSDPPFDEQDRADARLGKPNRGGGDLRQKGAAGGRGGAPEKAGLPHHGQTPPDLRLEDHHEHHDEVAEDVAHKPLKGDHPDPFGGDEQAENDHEP